MEHAYGLRPDDFAIGDRVATHPATDAFMRGERYGTVEKIGRYTVIVHLDHGWTTRLYPGDLRLTGTAVRESDR